MAQEEYIPIGSDPIKIYGFGFGKYRYQVEYFDHNKGENISIDDDVYARIIKGGSHYDTLYGTRVYRFDDGCECVHSFLCFNKFIKKDELKQMILDDVINWSLQDSYDFKDRFFTDMYEHHFSTLFVSEKDDVKLPYPECTNPYKTCPICGGDISGFDMYTEDAVDIFNSHVRTNYEGEPDGWWHEVHRCPHCDKLFFIEECL